jgi:cytochrome c-type biogenesis protein CcmH
LRCLVCQNQSIDDSDAPLAKDLRVLVRERLVAGDSDGQVRTFLVARYGEFVLLKPTWSIANLLLWLTAPVVLLLGAAAAIWRVRKSTGRAETDLTPEEERALAKILDDKA